MNNSIETKIDELCEKYNKIDSSDFCLGIIDDGDKREDFEHIRIQ